MTSSNPVIVEYSISWPDKDASITRTVEINRELWNSMNRADRWNLVDRTVEREIAGQISWGWTIPDENDWADVE